MLPGLQKFNVKKSVGLYYLDKYSLFIIAID